MAMTRITQLLFPALIAGVIAGPAAAAGQGGHHHAHWMAPPAAAQKPNPVKPDAASLARGKKLYEANCVSCHGAGGRGDGPAAKALNPRPVDLVQMAPMHPDGDFAWKISEGRGPMPSWKATLKEAEIWDVVNYIKRGFAKR